MRPAKSSFDVRCSIPGELKVLVVDATANVKKFEHNLTQAIVADLHANGVRTTTTSPVLATNFHAFSAAFDVNEEWNALLLVSHGRAVPVPDGADVLRLADIRANWFLANGLDMRLKDKAVFLAVCEGACEDAVYVLLRDQLALLLVAPAERLKGTEAKAFFPAVLGDLRQASELTPEVVNAAVRQRASLGGGKMRLLSAVGIA